MSLAVERLVQDAAHIYANDEDRFIVVLAVGYTERDLADAGEPVSPEAAAKAALDLTQDLGSPDTVWIVCDRQTGQVHHLEQSEFEEVDA